MVNRGSRPSIRRISSQCECGIVISWWLPPAEAISQSTHRSRLGCRSVAFVEIEVAFQKMSGTDSAHYVLKHKSAITADFQGDICLSETSKRLAFSGSKCMCRCAMMSPGLCDCTGRADHLERKRTVQMARFLDRAFRHSKLEDIACQNLALRLGTGRAEDAHTFKPALGTDNGHCFRGRELPGLQQRFGSGETAARAEESNKIFGTEVDMAIGKVDDHASLRHGILPARSGYGPRASISRRPAGSCTLRRRRLSPPSANESHILDSCA